MNYRTIYLNTIRNSLNRLWLTHIGQINVSTHISIHTYQSYPAYFQGHIQSYDSMVNVIGRFYGKHEM